MKSSTYDFHVKTKVLAYFQICISVPLIIISKISRFVLNVEVDRQICGVKFSIKLFSANVSLIHLWRVSIEATSYGFR